MTYKNTLPAVFLSRPNRFTAVCSVNGREQICHVKNTGRCRELLTESASVILQKSENPLRKTAYDLISVYKGDMLVNMDSQAPNKVFAENIPRFFGKDAVFKPEFKYGDSRIDFFISSAGEKFLAEVKGVTLEKDGTALFPDAPTERGVKHVNELIKAVKEGFKAYIVFVVQMMPISHFSPNTETQPEFHEALKRAQKAGVKLIAFQCRVMENSLEYHSQVPVVL